ncbi:hypothetical protein MPLB_40090 [Mesorhizobium sp. ORS 3324]|nr:hypothetical protein MPLB_40090 [Mesorhizobium sp. ORS 3324]
MRAAGGSKVLPKKIWPRHSISLNGSAGTLAKVWFCRRTDHCRRRTIYRFVILGRSKERSDAAQTRGSMP